MTSVLLANGGIIDRTHEYGLSRLLILSAYLSNFIIRRTYRIGNSLPLRICGELGWSATFRIGRCGEYLVNDDRHLGKAS